MEYLISLFEEGRLSELNEVLETSLKKDVRLFALRCSNLSKLLSVAIAQKYNRIVLAFHLFNPFVELPFKEVIDHNNMYVLKLITSKKKIWKHKEIYDYAVTKNCDPEIMTYLHNLMVGNDPISNIMNIIIKNWIIPFMNDKTLDMPEKMEAYHAIYKIAEHQRSSTIREKYKKNISTRIIQTIQMMYVILHNERGIVPDMSNLIRQLNYILSQRFSRSCVEINLEDIINNLDEVHRIYTGFKCMQLRFPESLCLEFVEYMNADFLRIFLHINSLRRL